MISAATLAQDVIIKTGASCPKFIQTYTSSGSKRSLYDICKVAHLTGPTSEGNYLIAGNSSYLIKPERVKWLEDNGYFVLDLEEQ